jgi:hypothetical protein
LIRLLVLVKVREMLLEVNKALCLEKEVLGALAKRKSAPEFSRVFAMSAKLTDFVAEERGVVEC